MWINPKLDWLMAAVATTDLNRLEGNERYLYDLVQGVLSDYDNVLENSDLIDTLLDYMLSVSFSSFATVTVVQSDTWRLSGYTASDPFFVCFTRIVGANTVGHKVLVGNDTYVLYDLINQPLAANVLDGTARAYYVPIVFNVETKRAYVLYNSLYTYAGLDNKAIINGRPILNTNTNLTLGIEGSNIPYGDSHTVSSFVDELIEPAIGEVVLTARHLDAKYLLCTGAEVSKTDYAELYSVVGDIYGPASTGMFKIPSTNFLMHNSYIKALP